MPEVATHLQKSTGRKVKLMLWTGNHIEGWEFYPSIYTGDVYFQTIEGEKTRQEIKQDICMLGQLDSAGIEAGFEPLPGFEDYHKRLVAAKLGVDECPTKS